LAPAGGGGIQYFIGDFDGRTFTNDYPGDVLWMDYGPDNYAGTTWNNEPDGKRIYIGWMNNWTYAERIPTTPWRGATTLPRELSLVETPNGIRLVQQPITAFEQLRELIGTWENINLTGTLPLEDLNGRTLEIVAEFEIGSAERLGIVVHSSEDADGTRVMYNSRLSQLLVSRADRVDGFLIDGLTPVFGAPFEIESDLLRLRIIVDESSVEVFANDGSVVMTSQTFTDPSANGISLFAENGEATLRRLEVYRLPSIWDGATITSGNFALCS
jgi:fructan beta-fructosidase